MSIDLERALLSWEIGIKDNLSLTYGDANLSHTHISQQCRSNLRERDIFVLVLLKGWNLCS